MVGCHSIWTPFGGSAVSGNGPTPSHCEKDHTESDFYSWRASRTMTFWLRTGEKFKIMEVKRVCVPLLSINLSSEFGKEQRQQFIKCPCSFHLVYLHSPSFYTHICIVRKKDLSMSKYSHAAKSLSCVKMLFLQGLYCYSGDLPAVS